MSRVIHCFRNCLLRRANLFRLWLTLGAAGFLLSSGCMTREMKGTPFFTGEYSKRNGPAEQRVNLWPLYYYRDPALSVIWPVIEFTDDHTAIRPVFSIYGLDETNRAHRTYNVVWPMTQFDGKERKNRIFPFIWSTNHTVLFPVYWQYGKIGSTNGGTVSVFPLALMDRNGKGQYSLLAPVPLGGVWRNQKTGGSDGSMFLPLYWHHKDGSQSLWLSLLWMHGADGTNADHWNLFSLLCFESKKGDNACVVTPLWSMGKTKTRNWHAVTPFIYWDTKQRSLFSPLWAQWERKDHQTWFSPAVLSWRKSYTNHSDLWMAGGLAKASWGTNAGPHYVFPLYWRDAAATNFYTPLFGWSRKPEGFWYAATPLAGGWSGQQHGGWLFPVFSHKTATNLVEDRFLLLTGRDATSNTVHHWTFPLYSYHDNGAITNLCTEDHPVWGKKFWCLPFCWYEHQRGYWTSLFPVPSTSRGTNDAFFPRTLQDRQYRFKHGIFPLYSYSTNAEPRKFNYVTKASAGLIFYDYKHELGPLPAKDSNKLNNYTRARILWRLWHYEKLNGDVGVDVFPGVTFDHKKDGYKKVTVWWRMFRYEKTAKNKVNMDLLFIPIRRS
jgi:hypothetical protein